VDVVAVAEARILQVLMVVVAVARLLSIDPESGEECAPFSGLLGDAIVVSTVPSGTKQGLASSRLRPPNNP
jgi:hypothetical protein